jgi:hypothetical protein
MNVNEFCAWKPRRKQQRTFATLSLLIIDPPVLVSSLDELSRANHEGELEG